MSFDLVREELACDFLGLARSARHAPAEPVSLHQFSNHLLKITATWISISIFTASKTVHLKSAAAAKREFQFQHFSTGLKIMASSPATPSASPFLTLPLEIRIEIYRYYFHSCRKSPTLSKRIPLWPNPELLDNTSFMLVHPRADRKSQNEPKFPRSEQPVCSAPADAFMMRQKRSCIRISCCSLVTASPPSLLLSS